MGIIVQKFGGSSVANTEKLKKVCRHILKEVNKGNQVVTVVSAQGKTTDRLIQEELEITNNPSKREHDVLVSVGEQITIAKLSMMLKELGYDSISYLGWQLPILTDSNFGDANIIKIGTDKILSALNENKIVVIAGFQGIDKNNNVTTLGRGGSDTTAVAVSAALHADRCDIFTDVDGVYEEDPNLNINTRKYDILTYDKMLQMANNGAKVLHNKSVSIAKENGVPINVKSTFVEESIGTLVSR